MSSTSRRRAAPERESAVVEPKASREGAVSALESHVGYWLRVVSNHVSHAFRVKVERLGVTVAEWVVMRALFDEGGMKPSVLAEKIGLTRGAVSKLVDRLATKKLIVVRADPRDGRAQVVALSASGRRLVPELAALADENDAEAFGHIAAEDRASLVRALRAVVDRLGLTEPPID